MFYDNHMTVQLMDIPDEFYVHTNNRKILTNRLSITMIYNNHINSTMNMMKNIYNRMTNTMIQSNTLYTMTFKMKL